MDELPVWIFRSKSPLEAIMPEELPSPTFKLPLASMVVAATTTTPFLELDMVSPLPKTISFPETVRSPVNDVVVDVKSNVPSIELVIVSSFSRIKPLDPDISTLLLTVTVSPLNPLALITPVDGLYVASPSDSKIISPPSTSPFEEKINAFVSFSFSLSVIETVFAVTLLHAPAPSPSEVHT